MWLRCHLCTPSDPKDILTFLFTCHSTMSVAFRDTENSECVPNVISHTHFSCLSIALPVINSTNSQVIHFQKAAKPKSYTPWCSIVSHVDYSQQLEYFGFGILGSGLWLVAACLDKILRPSTDSGQTCHPTFTYTVYSTSHGRRLVSPPGLNTELRLRYTW